MQRKEEENDMPNPALTRAETQEQLETDGLPVADFFEEETGGEWMWKSKVVAFDKILEFAEGSTREIKFKVNVMVFQFLGLEGGFKIELHKRQTRP